MPEGDSHHLAHFLEDRDVLCPHCRYNLKSLKSDRCPECGLKLRLSIGLAEAYLAPWVLLAVTSAAAGGVGVIFGYYLLRLDWWQLPKMARAPIDYFAFMIPVSVLAIVLRRRFIRLSPRNQWAISLAVSVITVLAFARLMVAISK
jgi:hypothetical protein